MYLRTTEKIPVDSVRYLPVIGSWVRQGEDEPLPEDDELRGVYRCRVRQTGAAGGYR